MGKKDKPGKTKSKSKQDAKSGNKDATSKKKSEKSAPQNEEKVLEHSADQQAVGEITGDAKIGSFSSHKDGQNVNDVAAGRNSKIASAPEWDSEAVRNANLMVDGFSSCIVLVMEDSAELSKYGEFLICAVETGVRRNFHCISGAQTAERVKRFLESHGQSVDDHSYMKKQELFAEAIKYTLLGIKEHVATEIDADHQKREMELAGARSKDLIRYVPPLTIAVPHATTTGDAGTPGAVGESDGFREPPPAPPPTESHAFSKISPQQTTAKQFATKKSLKGNKQTSDDAVVSKQQMSSSPGAPSTKMGVKTRMRRRGEVPMPEFEVIDDSPPTGPRSYILLQGFYNPRLIDELRNMGVKVDGILLMTDAKVNRYNFSIIDVEDSIPGTFRPRNVLPQYLKALERLSQNPETRNSEVSRFWTKLSEMYNSASVDSPFHDIALMNFPLPDLKKVNLESSDGLTYYISKVYDEVAKRIYEMQVLEGWFQEFSWTADVTKLQPLEPVLPRDIYDQIMGQIPSECISVPIILEAVVQQVAYTLEKEAGNVVPEPCYDNDTTVGIITGISSFGSTNWGLAAPQNQKMENKTSVELLNKDDKYEKNSRNSLQVGSVISSSSLFSSPMYIKSGDYASIRSCHLSEGLASKIASCQLSGDIQNIQGFLWQKMPEFNRGLYMKLLGNLNHFMHFMPPEMIQFEDMFYVLHLLMCAGVEIHLQKAAVETKKNSSADGKTTSDSMINQDAGENIKFPGTNLDMDRNYLAVSKITGNQLVISPNSNQKLTVASLGQSSNNRSTEEEKIDSKNVLTNFMKEEELQTKFANLPSETDDPPETTHSGGGEPHKKLRKKRSKAQKRHNDVLDVNKAARVTTLGAIQTAAKYADNQNENTAKAEFELLEKRKNKNKSKNKKGKDIEISVTESLNGKSSKPESVKGSQVGDFENEGGCEPKRRSKTWGEGKALAGQQMNSKDVVSLLEQGDQSTAHGTHSQNASVVTSSVGGKLSESSVKKLGFSAMNYPSVDTKRFIACEEEWFEDIHDTSVVQALLECPALLAINESGALDLSKWIEKYLLSVGMKIGVEDGVLCGDIKNWNYVEELVPIQTVQMLNEACQEYMSMQRMYCPFYDTIMFIFNNPIPKELTAETQFYFRLKTMPGLQHFLEYTMDDQNVLRWIEKLDVDKRLEAGDQVSMNTLLNIIPEEQWLLVPSIKYQIMVDNQGALSLSESNGRLSNYMGKFYGKIEGYAGVSNEIRGIPTLSGEGSGVSTREFSPDTMTDMFASSTVKENDTVTSEPLAIVQNTDGSEIVTGDKESKTTTPSSRGAKSLNSSTKTKSEKTNKKSEKTSRASRNDVISVIDATNAGNPTSNDKNLRESTVVEAQIPPPTDDTNGMATPKEEDLINTNLTFTCYDLGKRMAVFGNDTFFLFPMDGTVIQYDISTIEPEYRMMQLTVTKNGHKTFFYPYYIPHDFDLSLEDYVVCPYFHMVLNNGTIFAFQDLRAEEAAPYLAINKKHQQNQLFSFEKVLFGKEVEKKLIEVATAENAAEEERVANASRGSAVSEGKLSEGKRKKSKSSAGSGRKEPESSTYKVNDDQPDDAGNSVGKKNAHKKGAGKEKKEKKTLNDKPLEVDKKEKKEKKGKKDKDKKGKGNKGETVEGKNEEESTVPTGLQNSELTPGETGNTEENETADEAMTPAPPPSSEVEDGLDVVPTEDGGEWMYPSSENSDDEAESQKRRLFFAPPWDDAVQVIQPMTHAFTATLPSGLMISVEDVPGPPLLRSVKQYYVGHGSAKSNIEGSRYYTMDGSVIKFLLNGCIQILTARGVTTNIDELAANSRRDADTFSAFGSASIVKIFNGEVILPNGQLWQVVNGKKVSKTPIYVFTTGPLAGGEVFRRRQDGVVYLHRYDGTVITHYPDGTRFTTRMVILEKNTPSPTILTNTSFKSVDSKTDAGNVTARVSASNVPNRASNTINGVIRKSTEKFGNRTSVEYAAGESMNTNDAEAAGFSKTDGNKSNDKVGDPSRGMIEELHEDEEFSDWVFVGLKYMIEHPNYSTVLFNTLSGNVHLKLPHGEWIRVFADGNVRISTEDQYSLDVDKDRAVFSHPPCAQGRQALPNITTVRLWHSAPPGEPEEIHNAMPVEPVDSSVVNILLPESTEPSHVESQVPLELPEETSDKEHQVVKKKSLNKHHGKSLHPKVKQREGAKTRGKATRIGSNMNAHNSRKEVPTIDNVENVPNTLKKSISEKEEILLDVPSKAATAQSITSEVQQPTKATPKSKESVRNDGGSLADFLMFRDETTFCKSVDSWNNRFLMNVYGETVVDKIEKEDTCAAMSTQQLIETLSEHAHLPKNFISGILKNTSSENLGAATKRLQAIRRSYNDSCRGTLPNTKIFVVKRDLTAFQYLQKSQVEDLVSKAYASRDSMVIVDPVPKRQPRKFVTIMQPVEEVGKPHGMWTRPYIEPMFRPRGVTNKQLRIATPNDLRWFGYILNSAHWKRPKFVLDPKEQYKEKKLAEQTAETTPGNAGSGNTLETESAEIGPPGDDVGEPRQFSEEDEGEEVDEGYSGEGEEEGETSGEEDTLQKKRSELEPPKANVEDDKKKKKKDKKEKDLVKKGKGKEKKSKGAKDSLSNIAEEEEDAEEDVSDDGNQYEMDPITGVFVRKSRSPQSSHKSDLQSIEPEVDDYPIGIEDLQGIYEIEREMRSSSNLPKISVKAHALPCNTKRAIVVRAVVQIPQVDENMQRALLAASMSYAETCKTEAAIFKTYKTEDPRSSEERKKQTEYKQQMIEQNIDEMHMLEQKPGPVLKFHF